MFNQLRPTLIIMLVMTSLSSCFIKGGSDSIDRPPFDMGLASYEQDWKVPLDSFHLLSPRIDLREGYMTKSDPQEMDKKKIELERQVKEFQADRHPSVPYHNLDLLNADVLTINGHLEYPPYYKYLNPERKVHTSEELTVDDQKYGVLISIISGVDSYDLLIVNLIVINNHNQTIIKSIRYEPVNVNAFKDGILDKYLNKAFTTAGL